METFQLEKELAPLPASLSTSATSVARTLPPSSSGFPPWPTLSTRLPSGDSSEPPRLVARPLAPSDQFRVQALYPYAKTDATELSFQAGDTILTLGLTDSGWWDGELKGIRGLFPSNYCCEFFLPFCFKFESA